MFTISKIPKTNFISLLSTIFTFLCPFLLSYPFLILYLVFSLHYILKIIYFLPPFFVVALVVLTGFFLILTNKTYIDCSKNEWGNDFPRIDKEEGEFYPVEALEFYTTVFETSVIDETDNNVGDSEEPPEEKILQAVESSILGISHNNEEEEKECRRSRDEALTCSLKEASFDDGRLEAPKSEVKEKNPKSEVKEKTFEEFLKEVEEVDDYKDCMEVEKQKPEPKMVKTESTKKSHSRRKSAKASIDFTQNGGRFSRKEKEWKKTLGCKLFEDKHSNNIEGYEAMDMLWETYEEKPSMGNSRNASNDENEEKGRKILTGYFEDQEDEEEIDVNVSCLHAFKFTGGKMNVGVGGKNIVRISKVIKGIRWLRSVTKHGKKINNNNEQKCYVITNN